MRKQNEMISMSLLPVRFHFYLILRDCNPGGECCWTSRLPELGTPPPGLYSPLLRKPGHQTHIRGNFPLPSLQPLMDPLKGKFYQMRPNYIMRKGPGFTAQL